MSLEIQEDKQFNIPEAEMTFSHTSLKVELAVIMGEVENLIKKGRKREALMALISARVKLVDSEFEPELKERVDTELNKLRQKINHI